MKNFIKEKFVPLLLWMKDSTTHKKGKLSMFKTWHFVAGLLGMWDYTLTFAIKLLTQTYNVMPTIIQFLERLSSTLSYSLYKKEFFLWSLIKVDYSN